MKYGEKREGTAQSWQSTPVVLYTHVHTHIYTFVYIFIPVYIIILPHKIFQNEKKGKKLGGSSESIIP